MRRARRALRARVRRPARESLVRRRPSFANVLCAGPDRPATFARLQRDRHLSRLQERRALCQSLLHPNPSHLHSTFGRLSIEIDADVGIFAQRRPRLGSETEGRRNETSKRNPGKRSRLLSRTKISELRKSFAARYFVTSRQGSLR